MTKIGFEDWAPPSLVELYEGLSKQIEQVPSDLVELLSMERFLSKQAAERDLLRNLLVEPSMRSAWRSFKKRDATTDDYIDFFYQIVRGLVVGIGDTHQESVARMDKIAKLAKQLSKELSEVPALDDGVFRFFRRRSTTTAGKEIIADFLIWQTLFGETLISRDVLDQLSAEAEGLNASGEDDRNFLPNPKADLPPLHKDE